MNTAHADLICSYGLIDVVMELWCYVKITIFCALISYVVHYSNVTSAPWCLRLPASQLFVEKVVQPNSKWILKLQITGPGDWWIPVTKGS